ncbi:hypothetical protein T01_11509 [Trichinella spiralis]|uniref:Uncharacterized protein n=1 Tax=Trichinella spiralis TaxID=6334 RepID=A0A0V1AIS4_TRISP|nr:hypothetical protein T01_11509 [Trichinella spiralis]
MLCMLLYIYGEWKLTGFFSIVVIADFQVEGCSAISAALLSF